MKEETPSKITYTGGDFAGYPAERWEFELGPKGFWSGTVTLKIPFGKTASGELLQNKQFDNLAASLRQKYGKTVPVPGGPTAAQATWKLTDPRTGVKDAYTIVLRYSWEPYYFTVRYYYDPSGAPPKPDPVAVKRKKDL